MIHSVSFQHLPITKLHHGKIDQGMDSLAMEEPLEIRVQYHSELGSTLKSISVTMRTPGQDEDLALGFLFTEGIIQSIQQIQAVHHSLFACAENKENTIQVVLSDGFTPNLQQAERNFYTTSSCGVCGKGSIESIKTVSQFTEIAANPFSLPSSLLMELPKRLRESQELFELTGGLHASALFDSQGNMMAMREDVGRHNALDKLIGYAFKNNLLPLSHSVLLLSGRASFELIQKASMAGIPIVAAMGAPSSLAVSLAAEMGITLIGFLNAHRFNIYTQEHRILLPIHENSH